MDKNRQARELAMQVIDEAVAYWFGMTVEELHARKKTRAGAVPRQIAIYLMKQLTGASVSEISAHFGGQHESTIRRSVMRVESLRQAVSAAELTVRGLIESIQLAMRQVDRERPGNNRKLLLMTRVRVVTDGTNQKLRSADPQKSVVIGQIHSMRRSPLFRQI